MEEKSKQLEREQDRLLKETDKEATTLKRHLAVQKKINENKKLKQQLNELKAANFRQTPAGKVVAVTKRGVVSLAKALKKVKIR